MTCNTNKDVKPLSTTLQVAYKDEFKDGDFPIVWENHGNFALRPQGGVKFWIASEGFSVPLRLYAPLGTSVGTSVGQIKARYTGINFVRGEVLAFNGSQEVTLKYPVNYVNISGTNFVNEDGSPASPTLQVVGPGIVRASKPVYGVAFANYDAPYRVYEYIYETTATGSSLAQVTGSMITGGSVYAHYGKKYVTHSAPELKFGETEFSEIYRVITELIIDEEEVWQKPKEWPDKTFNDEKPDPDEAYLEQENVHEIGQIAEELCKREVKYYSPLPGKNPDNQELIYKLKTNPPQGGCLSLYNSMIDSVKARYSQQGKTLVED